MQYFQEAHQITRVQDITETSLNSYMLYLEKNHFAASTVSRSVASMRAFFQYLYQEHLIENNPADHLHPPKVKKDATDFVCGGSGICFFVSRRTGRRKDCGIGQCWNCCMPPESGSVN